MRGVGEGYIKNYFKQHYKILTRLKEIAQIMYENSEGHDLGPYQVEGDVESIEQGEHYVTLSLHATIPYEDWGDEESYEIPYSYLNASDEDIAKDVKVKADIAYTQDIERRVKALRDEAELLGYVVNEEGASYD